MGCEGLHCDGCGHGKGPGVIGAALLLVIVGIVASAHKAIGQAATDVGHIIMITAEVIAGIGAVALAGAITYGSVRAVKAVRASTWYQARAADRRAVSASSGPPVLYAVRTDRPAIAPVRPTLADTSRQAEPVPGTVER